MKQGPSSNACLTGPVAEGSEWGGKLWRWSSIRTKRGIRWGISWTQGNTPAKGAPPHHNTMNRSRVGGGPFRWRGGDGVYRGSKCPAAVQQRVQTRAGRGNWAGWAGGARRLGGKEGGKGSDQLLLVGVGLHEGGWFLDLVGQDGVVVAGPCNKHQPTAQQPWMSA